MKTIPIADIQDLASAASKAAPPDTAGKQQKLVEQLGDWIFPAPAYIVLELLYDGGDERLPYLPALVIQLIIPNHLRQLRSNIIKPAH